MEQRIAFQELPNGLTDGLFKTELFIKKSGLDAKLLELVRYRVSSINGCGYCLDMHHKETMKLGETEQRLHTLVAWRECRYYTEQERAALALAEVVTNASQQEVSDEQYTTLQGLFSAAEIATLILAIAQINTWNRISKTFRFEPGSYQVAG